MRFVSVRELRGRSAEIWKELAAERELIITSNGKPIGILSATSEETLEATVRGIRRARALAAVETMQRRSVQGGHEEIPPDEIDAEIAVVRSERKSAR